MKLVMRDVGKIFVPEDFYCEVEGEVKYKEIRSLEVKGGFFLTGSGNLVNENLEISAENIFVKVYCGVKMIKSTKTNVLAENIIDAQNIFSAKNIIIKGRCRARKIEAKGNVTLEGKTVVEEIRAQTLEAKGKLIAERIYASTVKFQMPPVKKDGRPTEIFFV